MTHSHHGSNTRSGGLPVINEDKRMVGILSLGDISHAAPRQLGEVLQSVSWRLTHEPSAEQRRCPEASPFLNDQNCSPTHL